MTFDAAYYAYGINAFAGPIVQMLVYMESNAHKALPKNLQLSPNDFEPPRPLSPEEKRQRKLKRKQFISDQSLLERYDIRAEAKFTTAIKEPHPYATKYFRPDIFREQEVPKPESFLRIRKLLLHHKLKNQIVVCERQKLANFKRFERIQKLKKKGHLKYLALVHLPEEIPGRLSSGKTIHDLLFAGFKKLVTKAFSNREASKSLGDMVVLSPFTTMKPSYSSIKSGRFSFHPHDAHLQEEAITLDQALNGKLQKLITSIGFRRLIELPSVAYLELPSFQFNIVSVAHILCVQIREKYMTSMKLNWMDALAGNLEHSKYREETADKLQETIKMNCDPVFGIRKGLRMDPEPIAEIAAQTCFKIDWVDKEDQKTKPVLSVFGFANGELRDTRGLGDSQLTDCYSGDNEGSDDGPLDESFVAERFGLSKALGLQRDFKI